MSKRKQDEDSSDESVGGVTSRSASLTGTDFKQTRDLVDVNFDYYNVDASNDHHAIHRLFIQLFGPDAERVKTGPLTELVASVAEESGVGSTIKTEEEEGSDPYAVLTVISCQDHAGLQPLIDYVLAKTNGDQVFHETLTKLLQNEHVGLVLSERLVNMPVQVMGPMYRMLLSEIKAAGRGYEFTHYLFVSRVYRLEEEDERHLKRAKTDVPASYDFHPEDAVIMAHATHTATYFLTDMCGGRAMIVPGSRIESLVEKMEEVYIT